MSAIRSNLGVLILLIAWTGATARAALELVEDFESMTGHPDGQSCTGVLGGTWDTQAENTGNINLLDFDGSKVVTVIGHSSGNNARGIAFNGISNPIEDGETGVVLFRFRLRAAVQTARTYIGLISDTGDNPVTSATADDPSGMVAGFGMLENGPQQFDIVQTDGTSLLKSGVPRNQWFNVWIVANNENDTIDLYLSETEGPTGEVTLPVPEDLVAGGIPFNEATTDPLTGVIWTNPAGNSLQAERFYIDSIYWDGDQGLSPPKAARRPGPENKATDVGRDMTLTWTPGTFAQTHDVYFGTDFADVNQASVTDPRGVLASAGQEDAHYDPGRLAFSETYFWRVDEVNGPPDFALHRGRVWQFIVEPIAIPVSGVAALASSTFGASAAENTVNGSGLVEDLHGTEAGDMWISNGVPATIEYAFDRAHRLHELWIWNANQRIETFVGFGAKEVVVEHSLDGENWTVLDGVPPLTQATGQEGSPPTDVVTFGGVAASRVRLTINSVFGLLPQGSLSEVRFYAIPTLASKPQPADGATDVPPDVTLSWGRNGREADRHDIYVGSEADALALAGSIGESHFSTEALDLQLDQTYHWRVDEVNEAKEPTLWAGNVWRFTTVSALVLDDMESYADAEFFEIWATWVDGFENPANGALVGNGVTGTPETGTVHGGRQSLPLHYDNTAAAQSEATRAFDPPRDWTRHGIKSLVLYFHGADSNSGGRLFVKVNDTRLDFDGDPTQLMTTGWHEWIIPLAALAGTDLSRVTSLTIGVDSGGMGVLYVDDILLDSRDL